MYSLRTRQVTEGIDQLLLEIQQKELVIPQHRIEKARRLPKGKGAVSLGAAILLGECFRERGLSWDMVEYTSLGKPFLPESGLHFSVSHSGNLVVAGFSAHPIGVDIEGWRLSSERVLARVLSVEERAGLSGLDLSEQHRRFSELWCLKEAFLKMTGEGIGVDMKKLWFDLGHGRVVPYGEAEGTIFELPFVAEGYSCGVAVRR